MVLPDYRGGGIVNLMSSLIAGFGGEPTGYPPLSGLSPDEFGAPRHVVLLIVDGLGYDYLLRRGGGSWLRQHLRGRLTSVFPSTTSAAMTTFYTGLAPQQHGLTGWHMYFRELGSVLAVLPGIPRYGGVPLKQCGIDPGRFFDHRPVFDRLPARSYLVSPRRIAHSDFNLAHRGDAELRTYDTMGEFFLAIAGILRHARQRSFVCAYWPELDHISHEAGSESVEAASHLEMFDGACRVFLKDIAGSDTLVVVTADHGFIDTCEQRTLDLDRHPDLADCLVLPLCGERRLAYCYVKSGRRDFFEEYVRSELGDYAELFLSRELIERGYFGLGEPHPRLAERVGDYALVMKDNCTVKDWLPTERRYGQIGVHGGVSGGEMHVPLVVAAV
jgi:hypothetical protein